ncbi:hypothetical protein NEAUS05_2026 [Nematocida ausubeli]|nr:hypothetical protein NEAUS05_2026 [Nematocida ausubeli]
MHKFSHESMIYLEEIADAELCREVDEMSDNDSICSEIESEIYSLIHFGRSETHKIDHLKKLQPVESNRYFQCSAVCYRCNQSGHLARDCSRPMLACYICKKTDHKKTECPRYFCKLCKKYGHSEAVCPIKQGQIKCSLCMSRSHKAIDCYMSKEKGSTAHICTYCGAGGHALSSCPRMQQNATNSTASTQNLPIKKTEEKKSKNKGKKGKKEKKDKLPSVPVAEVADEGIKKGKKKKRKNVTE